MPSRSDYGIVSTTTSANSSCLRVLREAGDLLDKLVLWNLGFYYHGSYADVLVLYGLLCRATWSQSPPPKFKAHLGGTWLPPIPLYEDEVYVPAWEWVTTYPKVRVQ